MSITKTKLLVNSFFTSCFNYHSMVWMCFSRLMNNKINHLQEKYLCIAYNDNTSPFKGLSE